MSPSPRPSSPRCCCASTRRRAALDAELRGGGRRGLRAAVEHRQQRSPAAGARPARVRGRCPLGARRLESAGRQGVISTSTSADCRESCAQSGCTVEVRRLLEAPPFSGRRRLGDPRGAHRDAAFAGPAHRQELKSGTTEASVYQAAGMDVVVFGPGEADGQHPSPERARAGGAARSRRSTCTPTSSRRLCGEGGPPKDGAGPERGTRIVEEATRPPSTRQPTVVTSAETAEHADRPSPWGGTPATATATGSAPSLAATVVSPFAARIRKAAPRHARASCRQTPSPGRRPEPTCTTMRPRPSV